MPSPKHLIRRVIDSLIRSLGTLFSVAKLPTVFNHKLIWVDVKNWRSIYQVYEPRVAVQLGKALTPGACFFDVGAHHGLWSLYAQNCVGPTGKIYSFEPSPAFDVLSRSAAGSRTIQPLRMGIGQNDGSATFFDQGEATSGSFVRSVTEINEPYAPKVPIGSQDCVLRSLDSLVTELGQTPKVIKMDIEGFEVEALKGASQLLKNKDVVWIIEVHSLQLERSGSSPEEVYRLLAESGCQIEVIDAPPEQPETILAYHQ